MPIGIGAGRIAIDTASATTNSPLLWQDTFTDSNGTLLTAHTPEVDTVGNGYTAPFGSSVEIWNNTAGANAGAVLDITLADLGQRASQYQFDAILGSNAAAVIILYFRTDATRTNRWRLDFKTTAFTLFEDNTQRDTVGHSLSSGTTVSVIVTDDGNNITVDVNSGTYTLSYTSTTHATETYWGIDHRSQADAVWAFDNMDIS